MNSRSFRLDELALEADDLLPAASEIVPDGYHEEAELAEAEFAEREISVCEVTAAQFSPGLSIRCEAELDTQDQECHTLWTNDSITESPLATAPHRGETDPALAYLASLAPTGRRTMRMRLEQVSEMLTGRKSLHGLPWEKLRYEHVAAIRSLLGERGLAPASINATLYAIRGVAKAAWHLDLMTAEEYARIRSVKPARGSRLPAGRSVASGELAALLESCMKDGTPAGTRDAALVGVLYCGGLRRAEVAALDVEDYDPATGSLKVLGKGDKERLVYIVGGAGEALRDWLDWRGAASFAASLDGSTPAGGPALPSTTPLFCPIRKNGSIQNRRMTDQAIYLILQKRAMEAGVLHCSPHDLRRTFVGDLLDREIDIVTVQQLAGHANVSTTARYDRRGERAKVKAANALHLPYRKRTG